MIPIERTFGLSSGKSSLTEWYERNAKFGLMVSSLSFPVLYATILRWGRDHLILLYEVLWTPYASTHLVTSAPDIHLPSI